MSADPAPSRDLPTPDLLLALRKDRDSLNPKTVKMVHDVLARQMAQAMTGRARYDDRAALVLTAVGGLAALFAGHLSTGPDACATSFREHGAAVDMLAPCTSPLVFVALVATTLVGVLLALALLAPSTIQYGPEPVWAAWNTDEDETVTEYALVAALAASIVSVEGVIQRKAVLWTRCVRCLGAALILVLVLGAVGGLR